jgi:undecaprenyl-diphosphatase
MKPFPLVAAALIVAALAIRWKQLPGPMRALAGTVALALIAWGSGNIHLPSLETIAREIGAALGPYTYAVVGAMALLETAAGTGLVAPGEAAVVIGGVTAGQGHTNLLVLIVVVWACAFTGDLTSYAIGRRLGRTFLLKHGHVIKLTPGRLRQVERYLKRHGGKTIIIGRFIGPVRALAPFVAGSSRMPARRFLPATCVAAGIWSAAFTILGYLFWQSFAQATEIARKGTFAFAALVIAIVVAVVVYRTLRTRDGRERLRGVLRVRARRSARPKFRERTQMGARPHGQAAPQSVGSRQPR